MFIFNPTQIYAKNNPYFSNNCVQFMIESLDDLDKDIHVNYYESNGKDGADIAVFTELSKKYKIKTKLWERAMSIGIDSVGSGLVLYGEIYGAGIQKNYEYGLDDIKFAGFDITVDGKYLSTETTEIVMDLLELPHVEILYDGSWSQEVQDKFVFNNFIEGTKVPHEGIVIKHFSGERQKVAKVINPDYLIYGEKNNVGDSH